jgi:hypothetical protein
VPWSLIGLILLLAAIGVGVWYALRWRRRTHRAEVAAAAAKARRDTERRLLGKTASANGNGGRSGPQADTGPAEAAAPGVTQDSGSTTE